MQLGVSCCSILCELDVHKKMGARAETNLLPVQDSNGTFPFLGDLAWWYARNGSQSLNFKPPVAEPWLCSIRSYDHYSATKENLLFRVSHIRWVK